MKVFIDDKCKKYLPIKSTSATFSSLPDDMNVCSVEFEYPVNFILYSKSTDKVYKMIGIVNDIKEMHVLNNNSVTSQEIVEIISIGDHYGISCTYPFWKYQTIRLFNNNYEIIIYDY